MGAPPVMKLRKGKAVRLDISNETREQKEEHDRMAPVLSDETTDDFVSQTFDFVDGEWVVKGGPLSSRMRSSGHPSAGNPSEPGHPSPSHSPKTMPSAAPAILPQAMTPPPSPLPPATPPPLPLG